MRTRNWDVKIRDFARAHIGREFVWGETDCVSFVRSALEIIYDEDVFEPVMPGNWATKIGAMRVYSKIDSFHDLLLGAGFVEIPKTVARDGDIIVAPGEGYENIAMIIGSRVINCNDETGRIEVKGVHLDHEDIKVYRLNG